VGISELSDAVVVILSEETGAISVAVGGMLKRHLAPQTLERLLRNELHEESTQKEENLVLMLRQKLQRSGKEDGSDVGK
jgi:diadenylate cyclase